MNIKKQNFLYCSVVALSMFCFTSMSTLAQDSVDDPIKIINRDGESVDSAELGQGKPIEATKPAAGLRGLRLGGLGAGAMIRNNNGKITIIDSDGEKQEIDIQGARSVSMSHSSRTVVVDGERKQEVVGKAVVVDADGVRHEYNLAPEAGTDGAMPGFSGTVRAGSASNEFMIGVNCRTVSGLLAAQLQLEPNTGLVVQSVSKGSPAAQAGIQKHDILMFAEDHGLSKISDLNEVVNKAGKEDTKVSLTVIRGGKEIGVDVGIVERPARLRDPIAGFPGLPGLDFEFRQVLPGSIIDLPARAELDMIPRMRGLDEEMQGQLDRMREQMDQLQDQMQRQLEVK